MYPKSYNPYHTPFNYYDQYYLNQVGSGMPIYRGSPILQRGYGLGGLLGGLFRKAVPLLKKGATMIGKQALRTGIGIADDVMAGHYIKTAAKRMIKAGTKQLGSDVLRRVQTGRGRGRPRKKAPRRVNKKRKQQHQKISSKGSKRRRRLYNDIFE